MTAREYIRRKGISKEKVTPETVFIGYVYNRKMDLASLLEEYHTLKSQEEAEERYMKGKLHYMGRDMEGERTQIIFEALRIASGKEE